jgi:hypothetical protein
MQQWEYAQSRYTAGKGSHRSVVFTHSPAWLQVADSYIGLLRQLGDEGWELVQISVSGDAKVSVGTFKRPRQDDAKGSEDQQVDSTL